MNTILSVRGLKTARDGHVIHDGLDLDLYHGETLVVLGGSGSGKTTLLRTLIGLERPEAGICEFDGKNLFALNESAWPQYRTQISYAFQGGALFDSLTVRENLEFPLIEHTKMTAKERRKRVAEQLATLGLSGIESQMPAELSGGMQKRVGVARAIILDPKIILYDEPTAGLDPENVGRINDTIHRLQDLGKTSIVVTHDIGCAMDVADRFVFLADGKVVANQTRAELDAAPNDYLKNYLEGAKHHANSGN